nr:hypothetical protein [Methylobacterium gnaphalii]
MNTLAFSPSKVRSARSLAERAEGAWRIVPLEGSFEIVYEDARGVWSSRMIEARELKLGPGRTLLGGLDHGRGLYRGFRTDRIRRLSDPETGLRIEAGILDHLLSRAEAQRRLRTGRARSTAASASSPRKGPQPSI